MGQKHPTAKARKTYLGVWGGGFSFSAFGVLGVPLRIPFKVSVGVQGLWASRVSSLCGWGFRAYMGFGA